MDTEQGGPVGEGGPTSTQSSGAEECVPEEAALELSFEGKRDEGGNSGKPQLREVLRGEAWHRSSEAFKQRGPGPSGKSGERRPGGEWIRLWMASLC